MTRDLILSLIRSNPGIRHSEIMHTLGVNKRLLNHHLARLRAAGLIQRATSLQEGRAILYYPETP